MPEETETQQAMTPEELETFKRLSAKMNRARTAEQVKAQGDYEALSGARGRMENGWGGTGGGAAVYADRAALVAAIYEDLAAVQGAVDELVEGLEEAATSAPSLKSVEGGRWSRFQALQKQ
jgi:hypothetical protein